MTNMTKRQTIVRLGAISTASASAGLLSSCGDSGDGSASVGGEPSQFNKKAVAGNIFRENGGSSSSLANTIPTPLAVQNDASLKWTISNSYPIGFTRILAGGVKLAAPNEVGVLSIDVGQNNQELVLSSVALGQGSKLTLYVAQSAKTATGYSSIPGSSVALYIDSSLIRVYLITPDTPTNSPGTDLGGVLLPAMTGVRTFQKISLAYSPTAGVKAEVVTGGQTLVVPIQGAAPSLNGTFASILSNTAGNAPATTAASIEANSTSANLVVLVEGTVGTAPLNNARPLPAPFVDNLAFRWTASSAVVRRLTGGFTLAKNYNPGIALINAGITKLKVSAKNVIANSEYIRVFCGVSAPNASPYGSGNGYFARLNEDKNSLQICSWTGNANPLVMASVVVSNFANAAFTLSIDYIADNLIATLQQGSNTWGCQATVIQTSALNGTYVGVESNGTRGTEIYIGEFCVEARTAVSDFIPATSGVRKITQKRNGAVIGTFTSFYAAMGPNQRQEADAILNYDIFEVDAAVYETTNGALGNTQDWINFGSRRNSNTVPPLVGVKIVGIPNSRGELPFLKCSQGLSKRPDGQYSGYVEFSGAKDCTLSNIYMEYVGPLANPEQGAAPAMIQYANNKGGNVIEKCAIKGMYRTGSNGLTGGSNNNYGKLTVRNCCFSENGGALTAPNGLNDDSTAHQIYVGYGPSRLLLERFELEVYGCYFERTFIGHSLKSRADKTTIHGNYFEGTIPTWLPLEATTKSGASAHIDLPNGGEVQAFNNIVTLGVTQIGDNSAGANDAQMVKFCGEAAFGNNVPPGIQEPSQDWHSFTTIHLSPLLSIPRLTELKQPLDRHSLLSCWQFPETIVLA
jgi:hypothetical protein